VGAETLCLSAQAAAALPRLLARGRARITLIRTCDATVRRARVAERDGWG